MFDLPERVPLAEQAADSIRKAIAADAWKGHLPSARRLCDIFRVSRPTIRAALHLLATDGWIEIRRRRYRLGSRSKSKTKHETRLVCFVTHLPVSRWSRAVYRAYADTRVRLTAHGFATEVVVCEGTGIRAMQRKLETYLKQNRVFCYVLLSIGNELQRWFADRPVTTLVMGSCGPTVKLPSFEIDLQSTSRHAAGVFLRHGHRRMAFVVPDTRRGGDLASEQGFLEGLGQAPARYGASAVIIRHNNTADMLVAKLDELFDAGDPPTAFLVAAPQYVYTLIFFLQRRGLRVPEDVSVIARDQDPYFLLVRPAITHYDFEGNVYARSFTRLMLKLVREGHLASKPKLIEQKYFEGGTVASRS